jgi:hypothetical protein
VVPASGGRSRPIAAFPLLPGDPVVVGEAVVVPGEGGRPDPAVGVSIVDLAGSNPRNLLPGWEGEVSEVAALLGRPDVVAFHAVRGCMGGSSPSNWRTGGRSQSPPNRSGTGARSSVARRSRRMATGCLRLVGRLDP